MPFGHHIFPTFRVRVLMFVDGGDFSGAILGQPNARTQAYAYTTMHHTFAVWPGWRGVRTERYNYARLEKEPWVLFRSGERSLRERNLVGEVAELDGLLQEAMGACGDTWRGVSQACGDWKAFGRETGSAARAGRRVQVLKRSGNG